MQEEAPLFEVYTPEEQKTLNSFFSQNNNFSCESFNDFVPYESEIPSPIDYVVRVTETIKILMSERAHGDCVDLVERAAELASTRIFYQLRSLMLNRLSQNISTVLTFGEVAEVVIVNYEEVRREVESAVMKQRLQQ
ncbi:MAG: hypothetical protein Q8O95_01810 [bacterium]|nr:hypothetical protein [bacterium]